jgi:cell wall-associated NlpC family hydrolase
VAVRRAVLRGGQEEVCELPPVKRRRGALGVALALAVSVCAFEAPAVSASPTVAVDQAGSIAYAWTGSGQASFEHWPGAIVDDAQISVRPVVAVPPQVEPAKPEARRRPPERTNQVDKPKPKPKVTSTQKNADVRQLIRLARKAIGARFRMGATGQRVGKRTYYDCSGLVYRIYREAGLLNRVGGARRGATSFYQWFKSRGLVSRKNPRPGDLVAYTYKGERVIHHIGIYIGHGRVISALINPWGVRSHSVRGLPTPFKAFLHVRNGG